MWQLSFIIYTGLFFVANFNPLSKYIDPKFTELSENETKSILFPATFLNDISKLYVTYRKSEIWCRIKDSYSFVQPKIQVNCECSCVDDDGNSTNFVAEPNNNCPFGFNEPGECLTLKKTQKEINICENAANINCQIHFPKYNDTELFYAIEIVPIQTVYFLTVKIEKKNGSIKNFNLSVPSDINFIKLDDDIFIELQTESVKEPLQKSWYYVKKSENVLKTSNIPLNKKNEINLTKLGWFSNGDTKLSEMAYTEIVKYFNVILLNCTSNPPLYKWTLNAAGICEQHEVCSDVDGKPVVEIESETVNNTTVDINSHEVIIQQKRSNTVKLKISDNNFDFATKNFALQTNILQRMNRKQKLEIIFTSQKGIYFLSVGFIEWSPFHTFKFEVQSEQPTYYSFELQDSVSVPSWVCIYSVTKGIKDFCQLTYSNITSLENNDILSFTIPPLSTGYIHQIDNEKNNVQHTSSNIQNPEKVVIALSCLIIVFFVTILGLVLRLYHLRTQILIYFEKNQTECFATHRQGVKTYPKTDIRDLNEAQTLMNSQSDIQDNEERNHVANTLESTIKNKLQNLYKDVNVPCVVYALQKKQRFEENYLNLKLKRVTINRVDIVTTKLQDIFQNETSRRILIEGNAGFGKTTLASKIAYDWANDASYLKKFDYVILIQLCSLRESLNQKFANLLQIEGIESSEIISILESNISKVLLILDGFDELSENQKESLSSLLKGSIYPKITILATARTGYFHNEVTSKARLRKVKITDKIWSDKYQILGVEEEKGEEFLQKCIEEAHIAKRKDAYEKLLPLKEKDILGSPMILTIVGQIMMESHNVLTSVTQLYKELLLFLVRRYVRVKQSEGRNQGLNQDWLNDHETDKQSMIILNEIAKEVWSLYGEKKLILKEDDLDNEIVAKLISIGIFINRKSLTDDREYEVVHKSLTDYLFAHHLQIIDLERNVREFNKNIQSLMKNPLQIFEDSMIFPFLAGLLGSKIIHVLQLLTVYEFQFKSYFDLLPEFLSECSCDDMIMEQISSFIPTLWKVPWTNDKYNFNKSILHSKIIECGIQNGRIKIVEWDLEYEGNFPDGLEVDKLILNLKNSIAPSNLEKSKRFKCSELLCLIFSEKEEMANENWEMFQEIISNVEWKSLSFQIWHCLPTYLQLLHKSINDVKLRIPSLLCLQCVFQDNSDYRGKQEILQILDQCSVTTLSLEFRGNCNEKKLFQDIANSLLDKISTNISIKKFVLLNRTGFNVSVDLKRLSGNSVKSFEYLWFNGCTLNSSNDQENWKLKVQNLTHFNFRKVLPLYLSEKVTDLSILSLEEEILSEELHHNSNSRTLLRNIKEFDLSFGRTDYVSSNFTTIQLMNNLKFLHLTFTSLRNRYFEIIAKDFTNTLFHPSLHIEMLMFWLIEENLQLSSKLIKALQSNFSKYRSKCTLKSIKLNFNIADQGDEEFQMFSKIVSDSKEFVKNEWIPRVSLITQIGPEVPLETKKFFNVLNENFHHDDEFNISNDFDGSSPEDCCYSKRYFIIRKMYERFTITKSRNYSVKKWDY